MVRSLRMIPIFLLSLFLVGFSATSTQYDRFSVSLNYNYDKNNNATVTLKYCNQTDLGGGCTPANDFGLTRGTGDFTGTVTSATFPAGYDPGDVIKYEMLASDADGAAGTPGNPLTGTVQLQPLINIADQTVTEGTVVGGANGVVVSLSAARASGDVTFNWATSDGTAKDLAADPDDDYTTASGTATITAGQTSVTLPNIATKDDSDVESTEYFTVTLSALTNVSPGDITGQVDLTDNDTAPTISVNDPTALTEGANVEFVATLSAARASGAVTFNYTTVDGTAKDLAADPDDDYTTVSGTGTILAGATTATITVATKDDSDPEAAEYFTLQLSGVTNIDASGNDFVGQATLNDNDAVNGITISNLVLSNATPTSFDAQFDFTGDDNSSATVTLYYCNDTDDGSCNPETPNAPGQGSVTMTRGSGIYTVSVSGLSTPNDPNDNFTVRVVVTDGDGVTGSLADDTIQLLPLSGNLGSFVISGVTGGTDVLVDSWLTNGGNPTIAFTTSANATSYDVSVLDLSNVVQCSQNVASSPSSPSGCSLSNATTYKVRVQAKVGSYGLNASNTNFNFYVNTAPQADAILSILDATPALMPSDGVAYGRLIVILKDANGNALPLGQSVEVTASSANVVYANGAGACRAPSAQCVKVSPDGSGNYYVEVKNATTETVTFTAQFVGTPDVNLTDSPSITFDSSQFTTISATSSVTSANAGQNIYITAGTITYDATTQGLSFGHLFIRGGTVQHTATTTATVYKLNINVASLTMTGGTINVSGKGYPAFWGYGATAPSQALRPAVGTQAPSHGGQGSTYYDYQSKLPTYGDYRKPDLPGAGGSVAGGGVVEIASTGYCTVNTGATIVSNGAGVNGWNSSTGAGGSVFMTCGGFSGTAGATAISAASPGNGNTTGPSGGGGRIAFISTGDENAWTGSFAYPKDIASLDAIKLKFNASGGAATGTTKLVGGAGTLFLKHSAQTYGALIIDNKDKLFDESYSGATTLTALEATLDSNSGTSLTITSTSGYPMGAGYEDIFKGMTLRPDIAYTNGTAANLSDDNILKVASNTTTDLVVENVGSGVSNGTTLRTIDVLDYFEISGNALVSGVGDVYVLNSIPGQDVEMNTLADRFAGVINNTMLVMKAGTYTIDTLPGVSLTLQGGTLSVNNLTLSQDLNISGGTLKHSPTTSTTVNKLIATVGGSFTMTGGTIDVSSIGYPAGWGYGTSGPSNNGIYLGSHGGQAGNYYDYDPEKMTYGNYRAPILPGSGGSGAPGGGVVQITATGACTINSGATIKSNGGFGASWNNISGAGGSVFLTCEGFSGTAGTDAIQARGSLNTNSSGACSGGGRIAFVSTGDASKWTGSFTYPTDITSLGALKLKFNASGGADSNTTIKRGGAGTLYLKHAAQSYGALIIDNKGRQYAEDYDGATLLVTMEATLDSNSGNNLTVTSTSGFPMGVGYEDVFKGMTLRPDIAYTNGTPADLSDDNILKVASNTTTDLVVENTGSGVSNGTTLRTIEVLDYFDISGNAMVKGVGDVYVLGSFAGQNMGLNNLDEKMSGAISNDGIVLSSGSYQFYSGDALTFSKGITVDGATLILDTLNVGIDLNLNSGSLTVNNLNVTGDFSIGGGTLSHFSSSSTVVNKFVANIGGAFTMTGGTIDVSSMGYPAGWGYGTSGPSNNGIYLGSHGGQAGTYYDYNPKKMTYGNYRAPILPGSGGSGAPGGGVVQITATGACTINSGATIKSNGGFGASWNNISGAGGSVFLTCEGFAGTAGTDAVQARGSLNTNSSGACSGGGRIAFVSTGDASKWTGSFAYPTDITSLDALKLKFNASGGADSNTTIRRGGAGTLYLKHAAQSYGALIIDNKGREYAEDYDGATLLVAMEATLDSNSGNNLTVTSTSGFPMGAGYEDVFKGMTLRPDIAYTNGTPVDLSDDNILKVANNTTTDLVVENTGSGISNGTTLRTIDVLDYFDISGNAVVKGIGDVYVLSSFASQKLGFHNLNNKLSGALLNYDVELPTGSYSFYSTSLVEFPANLTLTNTNLTLDSLTVGGNINLINGTYNLNTVNVTNNFTMSGGTLRHYKTTTTAVYRLNIGVGGAFTLGGGSINLYGYGYPGEWGYGPSGPSQVLRPIDNNYGGSHGGVGASRIGSGHLETYGDYRAPILPGAGSSHPTYAGGGAVQVTATNICTINSGASINANAEQYNHGSYAQGAGGSVYFNCEGYAGTAGADAIQARGGDNNGVGSGGGGGGRIAFVSTGDTSKWTGSFVYPSDQTTLNNIKSKFSVRGGIGTSAYRGAAGTLYLKNGLQSYGALIIDNKNEVLTEPYSGRTKLVSFSGSIDSNSGNNLTVNVTSGQSLDADHVNLYSGMTLRPDIAYTNGTPTNLSDDNVLKVASNTATDLVVQNTGSGVSNGTTLRTIEVLDLLDVSNNAILSSVGDIYVLGTFSGQTEIGLNDLDDRLMGAIDNSVLTISGGTYTLESLDTVGFNMTGGTLNVNNLNVANNFTMSGGTLKHYKTTTTNIYKLNIDVGGSFTMSGGTLYAYDLGYPGEWGYGPSGPSQALRPTTDGLGGSHGGVGASKTGAGFLETYDDYRAPTLPGAGSSHASYAGGGVVQVTATNICTINTGAVINANAGAYNHSSHALGAGGSVYFNCEGFAGTAGADAIQARGGDNNSAASGGGGGGRIAFVSTGDDTKWTGNFAYPTDSTKLTSIKSVFSARGGAGTGAYPGGAGTLYLKHSAETYGSLIVDNEGNTYNATYSGKTKLLQSFANANVLDSQISTNEVKVTAAGTPFANMVDIFKGYAVQTFLTTDPVDPLDGSHVTSTLTGNTDNSLVVTDGSFSAVGSATHNYRFTYRLDSLDISGNGQVDMTDADLILESCDIHSNNTTTFDVPAGSKITGGSIASTNCLDANVTTKTTTVNFLNYFLP